MYIAGGNDVPRDVLQVVMMYHVMYIAGGNDVPRDVLQVVMMCLLVQPSLFFLQ